ncbi:MAG: hypothetical protein ABIA37_03235 [Candidatus Woesearchaeota archaeon]
MDEKIIGLSKILGNLDDKQEYLRFFEDCLDPFCLGSKISLKRLSDLYTQLQSAVAKANKTELDQIFQETRNILHQKGYHEERLFYTYQEHRLIGSTFFEQEPEEFYQPVSVMIGELEISEAQKARRLVKTVNILGDYFCIDDIFARASLEPLDQEGKTVNDPQRLDNLLNPLPTEYSSDFPFRRG